LDGATMIDDEERQRHLNCIPPVLIWAGVMVALTFGAAAAGRSWALDWRNPDKDSRVRQGSGVISEMKYGGEISLRELPPIIANLAEPSDAWSECRPRLCLTARRSQNPISLPRRLAKISLASCGPCQRRRLAAPAFAAFAGRFERTRRHSLRRIGARAHHSTLVSMKKSFLVLALALVMVSATAASAQMPDLNSLIRWRRTVTSRIIQLLLY